MTEKIGVMVIHGIGDPAPGEALRDLTDALSNYKAQDGTAASFVFGPAEEKRLATQHPYKPWLATFFPMFVRQGGVRKDNTTVVDPERQWVFAEVFWGSASQLPAGSLGMMQGLVRLFFRSNVIVKLAAEKQSTQPGALAWLRKGFYLIAQVTSHLLTGPIFALNILLLLAMLVYHFGIPVLAADNVARANKLVLYGSGGLGVVIGIALLGVNRWRPRTFVQHLVGPTWWLLGVVTLWWLCVWGGTLKFIEDAVEPLIIANGCPAPPTINPLASELELLAMPLQAALLGVFLLTITGLALLIVSSGVHWVVAKGFQPAAKTHGPPLLISLFTLLVQSGLWVGVVPTLWVLLLRILGNDQLLDCLNRKGVLADGLQWLMLGLVIVCGLLTLAVRWRKTQQIIQVAQRAQVLPVQGTARLIVHPLLIVPTAVALLAAVYALWAVNVLKQPIPAFAQAILTWLTGHPMTPVIASVTLLVIPLLISPLRLALDLVNDIINYEAENEAQTKAHQAQKNILHQRPLANAIRPRFRLVLDYLLATEQVTRVVIIAHSLGSVIALDELACADNQQLAYYQGKITLITIGSPIAHLYQHYFPGAYPGWDDTAHWSPLFKRVQCWRHYYRIDDYVGMDLQPIPLDLTDFAQMGLGAGGHTEYWQDDRFVKELYPELQQVLLGR